LERAQFRLSAKTPAEAELPQLEPPRKGNYGLPPPICCAVCGGVLLLVTCGVHGGFIFCRVNPVWK